MSADRPALPVRRFLLVLAMCLVLGGLGGLLAAELQKEAEARPSFIPPREEARDFRLHDEDGKWRTLEDARGDVVVLTFLYSGCWDLCPAQALKIVQAVSKVAGPGIVPRHGALSHERSGGDSHSCCGTPGYSLPFRRPARCAALDASMAAVRATWSGVSGRSTKFVLCIASPTQ